MISLRRLAAGLRVCLFATVVLAAAHAAPPPPVEAFFDDGAVQDMRLSPNGRWLASRALPAGGGPSRLVLVDLDGKEPTKVLVSFARAQVTRVRWVDDESLLITAVEVNHRGTERVFPATLAVRRDGSSLRTLIKAEFSGDIPAPGPRPLEPNHEVLALGAPGSGEVIVGEHLVGPGGELKAVNPLAVNVRSGARRSLVRSLPPDAVEWLFDPLGQPRLAVTQRDGQRSFLWFDADKQAFREIARHRVLEAPFSPRFVDGDGQLYVQVVGADGGDELRRFDFTSGQPAAEAVAATPGFDGGIDPVFDRATGALLGLRLVREARQTQWLTPSHQALQRQVDSALPGRQNDLLCAPCTGLEALLVFSHGERHPGEFYLFGPASGELQRVGSVRPRIDASAMAPLRFERIRTRDGAALPVWVTLPADDAKARSAVLLVHGGPWVRGREREWDAASQFLASRGHVVIEPEFRGSAGYGNAHLRAGFGQWGAAMQDDLDDAVAWAVKQGWVDPKRVCIAGGSYGGYAALMGLARTPGAFRCGVAWAAVSDPRLLFSIFWSDIGREARQYSMTALIGDPARDAERLAAAAPLNLAARIQAPLLLAHGALDRRVPLEHGERMRDALRQAGRSPDWVLYRDEGHDWSRLDTRLDFWKRVEAFLARHLAP
ncbi:MAG: S9 family peptidase [Rubrivivax sp.]|nr:S9 family peptidase [Rubrivivax sp.]